MKCPVCSFETGHYVCSRAPIISLAEELEKKNKMLLEAAKNAHDEFIERGLNDFHAKAMVKELAEVISKNRRCGHED